MLDSECLFDDEYGKFFKSLSNMNIVLLAKYIEEYGTIKEWYAIFYEFIENFSESDKSNINKLKEKIVLR